MRLKPEGDVFVDADWEEKRGVGIEAAWAAAVAALPTDARIYHLAADSFMGSTEPGGWEVFAHCERKGWRRTWVGRGSTAVAALLDLADYATKYGDVTAG